ncbi:ATP-binding cassette domain-containing protein, partial [Klebsiella pneumoniae]|uniref:ATP-binding cassette domain-containing protein n=1 Tax=Klebsiella pneumoniae TaxID=573 RepID=UPI003F29D09E
MLTIRGLTVRYGGVTAVSDVDLEVASGEIVGLIGPNGAGKTTAIDAISGFAAADGSVRLGDAEISSLKPHLRVSQGLGR